MYLAVDGERRKGFKRVEETRAGRVRRAVASIAASRLRVDDGQAGGLDRVSWSSEGVDCSKSGGDVAGGDGDAKRERLVRSKTGKKVGNVVFL